MSCRGTNRQGEPCGARALSGEDFCRAHLEGLPPAERFGSPEQARLAATGVDRHIPKVTELRREMVEAAAHEALKPYFHALGIVDWQRDEDGRLVPVVDESKGAMELGRSHKGDVYETNIPDLGARMTAAERLFDRVYGRPGQAIELSGPEGGPIGVQDETPRYDWSKLSVEELCTVRDLLRQAQPD